MVFQLLEVINSKGINVIWLNHKLTDQEIDLNFAEKLTFEIKLYQ